MNTQQTYFAGKKIWVTGASSGIGLSIARKLAQYNTKLIVSARRAERLTTLQREIRTETTEVAVLPVDLEDVDSLGECAETALNIFGGIDMFISNAGVSMRACVRDTEIHVIRRIMDVNFTSSAALTMQLLPSMLSQGHGHIVTVSSVMGKFATPLRSGYCASKHAIHGFYESLAAEVYDAGVRVTIIVPGWIKTEVSAAALGGDGSAHGVTDPGQAHAKGPDEYVDSILRAVARGKSEHFVALDGRIRLGLALKRFLPGVLRRSVRRVRVT